MKKDRLILFLYSNGESPVEIAKKLNVTPNMVYAVVGKAKKADYRKSTKNAVYHTEEYKKMRKAVIERDGGRCVKCGSAKNIQIDHVKAKSTNLDLIFEMANLRCLCKRCHSKEQTSIAYRRFNRKKS